jgi:hypothetical protein
MSELEHSELEFELSELVRTSMRPTPWARRPVILLLIISLIAVFIGSGLLATHQFSTPGSPGPSISGGWYGGYRVAQPGTGKYLEGYTLYVVFASGQGHQVSATTNSCTTASNGLYTQAPTPGLDYTGTIRGSEFKMSSEPGNIEGALSWLGTYSTSKIHIDFFTTDSPESRIAYVNLQRGTFRDYLATCNVK